MGNLSYHFGQFSLNPLARELRQDGELVALSASAFDCLVYLIEHRERPVGKDELISAVWGRVDVSDSLLAQTIVRLRRALGDAGSEQHIIKTVARVGYRWTMDIQVVEAPAEDAAPLAQVQGEASPALAPTAAARRSTRTWLYLLAVGACAVIGLGAYGVWRSHHSVAASSAIRFDKGSAIVLPADVHAPADWNWLHFGLMDLVSSRLRDASIPTENSQAVLELLKDAAGTPAAELPARMGFALTVQPQVSLDGENWQATLDARSADGRSWKAQASSTDVLKAVRAASDVLLAQLGYGVKGDAAQSSLSRLEYVQRIDAARLAGQPAVARALLEHVPANLRDDPELVFIAAAIDCDEGKTAVCKQGLLDLLKRLDRQPDPVVRGEVLTILGLIYQQEGDFAKSVATLTDAIHTLEGHDNEALATALLDRSYVEQLLWKLEDATADIGRAHVTYALAGDAVGAAKTDFEMALMAERRAQPDAAINLLQRVYERFQRMGMRSMLPSVLDGMANAQKMLLKYADELATTDRFWPLDAHDLGFIDRQMRRELSMVRAIALADNGRSGEATALAQSLVDDTRPDDDDGLLAETHKLLAEIAFSIGDNERAAALAAKALLPVLASADQRDYASVWLTRINALQQAGHTADVAREAAAMQAWRDHLAFQDDWVDVYVIQARAAQLWSSGQHDAALAQMKTAMELAEKFGVPDVVVSTGVPYGLALLAAGKLDQAMAVSGRMSIWSNADWRAAWLEACIYRALGQNDSWNSARARTQQLAGDRPLPEAPRRLP
ncbi:winged helix-turn-helix domain-containing protein [Dyella acidiphila]|uniref:Transcriptional regulator n=1 Tax=Dyella acidiphila TaxID=2775866 RepID=A0ABR9GCZ0_9GAMM|nr:transcriptional regulator [Dyella acidiphila]MBE1161859.1 transcriptional regulator [Dyella acidiphila]